MGSTFWVAAHMYLRRSSAFTDLDARMGGAVNAVVDEITVVSLGKDDVIGISPHNGCS
jgi:hypothetical protein